MTGRGPSSGGRFPIALLLLGVALRVPGLLFNGMADVYQILLEWGAAVHRHGLVDAFAVNYGILSYAAFGAAEVAGEWIPRFWWAPYKLLVIGFDLAACLTLVALAAPRDRRWVVLLVWINPWFILHGAYWGFWEGPHLLFGLLAVLALRRLPDQRRAWAAAGALVMCSAMIKPQGLFHFAGPLGLYLAVQCVRGIRRPIVWFVAGLGTVALATTLAIWLAGGSPLALYDNYRSVSTSMAKMSNGGPGLWRFVSWAYMEATGQPGLVLDMKISRPALAAGNALAGLICLGMLLAFSVRLGLRRREPAAPLVAAAARRLRPPAVSWPDDQVAFIVLTLGTLVMSQFGPRAHINHSYVALMLLVPLALHDRVLLWLWGATTLMLWLAHVSTFGFGGAVVMLPASQWFRYPDAGVLFDRIRDLPAYVAPDRLLAFQAAVNDGLAWLPGPRAISMMSVLVFVAACGIVWRLFRSLDDPAGAAVR